MDDTTLRVLATIVPLAPLAAFAVNVFFGRRQLHHLTGLIASAALAVSALCATGIFLGTLGRHPAAIVTLYRWIGVGNFQIDVSFQIDQLSTLMMLVVTWISFLIHVYSIGYMHEDHGYWRFFSWLPLFVFFMLVLVMADNYLLMFVGWEGVGLCSYLLIGFWFEKPAPQAAANKAFWMNRIGDWGFMVGVILIFLTFGSLTFRDVFANVGIAHRELVTAICLLLFLGATGKSAQIPLYTWLPDAMEGPTPVSALIHAATMVTAGVYMTARSTPLFAEAGPALLVVAVIGTATAVLAATIALVQTDIKRVLAYSTVSQLGYMFLGVGVGAPIAAMFHLATHAFFKALLFLGSGSVIHALGGEQDMRRMGGLRPKLPITYWTMLLGGLALAAIPPLAGFWSKDEIVNSAFFHGQGYEWFWAIGVTTGALTAFYTMRMLWLTFHGAPREHHLFEHAHESPRVMTIPLIALAIGAALSGLVLGWPPDAGWVDQYLGPLFERAEAVDYSRIAVLASIAAVAGVLGIGLAWLTYARGRPDPERVRRTFLPIYTLLANKWYVDTFYDNYVASALRLLFGASWAFDLAFIDGFVNKLAAGFQIGGRNLRRLQTGIVGNYALTIVLGLLFVGAAYAYLRLRQ
ncbi:MAG: NADH-quinone oxidoreductase subunit L [Chloroflexi bacterium 13_1_40CM_4_68_4]|nr:MAG: NADH-quinone oxidoreductase subunit L [Chloroflexi bacterium 13_1_40CM_4_68_4]